jgi:hypothetical protein
MNPSSDPMPTATPGADFPATGGIPLPRLSDDAVVQIHDFLHHVLDLFEARYGDQIHRFYEDLCSDCFGSDDTEAGADPPF